MTQGHPHESQSVSTSLFLLRNWVNINGTEGLNFRGVLAPDQEDALLRGRLLESFYNNNYVSESWRFECAAELVPIDLVEDLTLTSLRLA